MNSVEIEAFAAKVLKLTAGMEQFRRKSRKESTS